MPTDRTQQTMDTHYARRAALAKQQAELKLLNKKKGRVLMAIRARWRRDCNALERARREQEETPCSNS